MEVVDVMYEVTVTDQDACISKHVFAAEDIDTAIEAATMLYRALFGDLVEVTVSETDKAMIEMPGRTWSDTYV